MTALTATAIITAVDRASAVFARVGANARALGGRFAAATGGLTRFGSAAAMNLGLPAAMVGGMAARGEYEIDKLARVMQAAGELSDKQREMLTDKAFEVSAATGQSAADILRGQRELILGGLDADTAAATSDIIAKVSRANEIAAGQVAEDAITNASALGLAMGTTEEKVASLTKTLDFMSTVPAFSPMNWQDLSTSMKYAGPVAGALKIQMKDLGAALSMLAFAGFKGEEAGTALRTILTRLVAPTRKARVELAAAGIDQTKLFKIDAAKANDKAAMLDGLVQQGLMTEKERARAEGILSKIEFDGTNAGQYTERVNAVLQRILGIGKGDTQDREILKAAIDNHMLRAVGDLDMEQVFTAIKDLPLKSLKEMFGLQRLSQARALVNKINEIVKLPNGERISAWKKLREEIGGAIDGASDRKAEPVMTGYSAAADKAAAAFANVRHQIFESGFGRDVSNMFERLSNSVSDLARTDPEQLRRIGLALAAIATAPLVGTGIAGMTALALAFTDLSKAFEGEKFNTVGAAGGILTEYRDAPIITTLGNVKQLFGEIGDSLAPLREGIANLFNVDPGDGSLVGWLKWMDEKLKSMSSYVKWAKAENEDTNQKILNPALDSQGQPDWYNRMRHGEAFTRRYNEVPKEGLPPLRLLFDPANDPFAARRRAYLGGVKSADPDSPFRRQFPEPPAAAPPLPLIRDQHPEAGMQRVDVKGEAKVGVTGTVTGTVRNELTVRYEGPLSGPTSVTGGAAVSGNLDPGESNMDLSGP